jgi:hypothetical protein
MQKCPSNQQFGEYVRLNYNLNKLTLSGHRVSEQTESFTKIKSERSGIEATDNFLTEHPILKKAVQGIWSYCSFSHF